MLNVVWINAIFMPGNFHIGKSVSLRYYRRLEQRGGKPDRAVRFGSSLKRRETLLSPPLVWGHALQEACNTTESSRRRGRDI